MSSTDNKVTCIKCGKRVHAVDTNYCGTEGRMCFRCSPKLNASTNKKRLRFDTAVEGVVREMEALAPEGLEPIDYRITYQIVRRWIKELKQSRDYEDID